MAKKYDIEDFLSPREVEIYNYLKYDYSLTDIATLTSTSYKTVKNHSYTINRISKLVDLLNSAT